MLVRLWKDEESKGGSSHVLSRDLSLHCFMPMSYPIGLLKLCLSTPVYEVTLGSSLLLNRLVFSPVHHLLVA